jgi:glycogen synthase kinase 3 beta
MWSAGCMLVELMTLEPIFPGDSSIEQLIEIIKILGTPSNEQVLSFSAGNDALQLPKVKGSDWDRILKRYNPSELEIDLIEKILTYDAAKRIKPLEALKHPYFADLATYPEV